MTGAERGMAERLHKYLARCGVTSRRAAEQWIAAGRVKVNGEVVDRLGVVVELGRDRVEVDGRVVEEPTALRHVILNKPPGILSAAVDRRGRRTVVDIVPSDVRLFPVGRLDLASEGLILLTNDGDLAWRLTHPRHAVEKEYRVMLSRRPNQPALDRLRRGVPLDGVPTAPAQVDVLEGVPGAWWVRVVLREGRYRQIRKMMEALDLRVERLIRVRIGPISLGDLAAGAWRPLRADEVGALREASR